MSDLLSLCSLLSCSALSSANEGDGWCNVSRRVACSCFRVCSCSSQDGCLVGSLTMCVLLLDPDRPTKMRTHTTIIARDFNAELGPGIGTERTH